MSQHRLAPADRRIERDVWQGNAPALCGGFTLVLRTGGGGGYGSPADRPAEEVQADVREGYVTEEHARQYYPHVFDAA